MTLREIREMAPRRPRYRPPPPPPPLPFVDRHDVRLAVTIATFVAILISVLGLLASSAELEATRDALATQRLMNAYDIMESRTASIPARMLALSIVIAE